MRAKIKRITYDADSNLGIEIIAIDNEYVASRENLLQPIRSSFFTILWFLEGSPTHLVDYQSVKIIEDSYLFVGKEVVQYFDQQESFKGFALLFTDDFLCRDNFDYHLFSNNILFNTINHQEAVCTIKAAPPLKEIWTLIKAELNNPKDIYQSHLLRNLLHNFLFTAERTTGQRNLNSSSHSAHLEILMKFKDLIEKKFKEQKPVIYYTDLLHVSNKVLSRVSQGIIGRTPKQMLDDRILLEAKRLLVNSLDAGKVIGYELGFKEPTNFIKYFRLRTGMTPIEFRSRYTEG
ncbi:AraC family transcriptional regulator [Flavobacterium piscisymbiosum]|uniref:Helix-turn-helix domain-containing protein n=1 Tax=Flavobacterium piscisymbiosum TaxID=2893753 RepID=A0ABS8ME40_9FLAO|nr:helix-turn-helix domain-containing protein [Flavobacterium sp. F-30]MCC9063724.1 helix-turn-helix domain-containing protein [Flavobacterium sp. F-30]